MFSIRDAIDHPAANGPSDDRIADRAEEIMAEIGDMYGVALTQAKCPKTKRMGWIASVTHDGDPIGKDSDWHDSISECASTGERMMDKKIEKDAYEQAEREWAAR